MFLQKADYTHLIEAETIDVITGSNDALLFQMQAFAEEVVKTKIRHRYDVAQIFLDIQDYIGATPYAIDDVVFYSDSIYVCTAATTGNLPTDTDYWEQTDPRNKLIRDYTAQITIYEIHTRIQPRNVPELLYIKRNDAYDHLKRIGDGKEQADLPLYTDEATEEQGRNFIWSSNPKTTQLY